MHVCTIIPTLRAELAKVTVETLLEQEHSYNHKIVIVTPVEEVANELESYFHDIYTVMILRAGKNLHYAGLVSYAQLKIGKTFDIWHISNDDIIYVDKKLIEKCCSPILKNRNIVGIVSPVLLSPDKNLDSVYVCHTCFGIGFELFRGLPQSIIQGKTSLTLLPVPYVSGACIFINSRLVIERGYIFDPRLGAFYEDIELCLYSWSRKKAVLVRLDTYAIHNRGTTYGTASPLKLYLSRSNGIYVTVLYDKRRMFETILASLLSTIYFVIKKRKIEAVSVLKGTIRGIKLLKQKLRILKPIQSAVHYCTCLPIPNKSTEIEMKFVTCLLRLYRKINKKAPKHVRPIKI